MMMNNAAVPGTDKYIRNKTVDNFLDTYKVDCMAAMLCTREVLNRSMIERKRHHQLLQRRRLGRQGAQNHYSARAHCPHQSDGQEVGQFNIRCNCVVPGAIGTDPDDQLHEADRRRAGRP